MADMVREDSVLTQDFTHIEADDFGLADVQFVDQHFIDPRGRTVRMRSFYRLMPGEVHYRNKPRGGEMRRRSSRTAARFQQGSPGRPPPALLGEDPDRHRAAVARFGARSDRADRRPCPLPSRRRLVRAVRGLQEARRA